MQDHSGRPAGEDAEQIFRRYADTLFRFCLFRYYSHMLLASLVLKSISF